DVRAYLEQARGKDGLRLQPGAAGAGVVQVHRRDRRGVEQVVDVEVQRGTRALEPQQLADAEVDLVEAPAERPAGRQQRHGGVGAARQRAPQRRLRDGVRRDVVGLQL